MCTTPQAKAIENEATDYFMAFASRAPLAYSYLASDRSELFGKICKKLTGKNVIID